MQQYTETREEKETESARLIAEMVAGHTRETFRSALSRRSNTNEITTTTTAINQTEKKPTVPNATNNKSKK